MHAWFQGKLFRIQINNEFMNKNNICCMEQHICILLIENNLSIKLYQKTNIPLNRYIIFDVAEYWVKLSSFIFIFFLSLFKITVAIFSCSGRLSIKLNN